LGVICGLIGLAMTKALFWLDDGFGKLPLRPVAVWAPVVGALALGVIGYFFPAVFGTGYDTIRAMLNAHLSASALLRVSAAKFWALVISLGSGTTGGVFAPSLVVGGGVGAAFAQAWHALLPQAPISPPAFYALAAMAAVFGSIARAPFTAVVFLFELSHNPESVLPLIVCVMIADGTMRLFSADSMMTGKLAKRGLIVSQDYVAPQFQLWSTQAAEIMRPVPDSGWSEAGALPAAPSESLATLAHRMIENNAEHALVMSAEAPPRKLGVVFIADIFALEQDMLKRHEAHRG